jgi:nicotinate-nucleotide pyrophosphorylase
VESKEHTELLISLGGATAVAKVRKEWPDNKDVQVEVQRLAKLLAAEMTRLAAVMNSWADEE